LQGVDRDFHENSTVVLKEGDVCRHIFGKDYNRTHNINYKSKAKYV